MTELKQVGESRLETILTTFEKNISQHKSEKRRLELELEREIDALNKKYQILFNNQDRLISRDEKALAKAKEDLEYFINRVKQKSEKMVENKVAGLEKETRAMEREMRAQGKALEDMSVRLLKYEEAPIAADQVALARAKTFAIVDSILFAIENWAEDDSPAPDITLAAPATLFPVLLNKVSQGDEDYYLEEVPMGAYEVVRRGRQFVKSFRDDEHISILNEDGWGVLQPILHSWWTRDAMPLLFDAGYVGWEKEEPLTRDQMFTWRDKEMSRAMDFPLIFDGFELVKKYGDQIRTETGLPEFNRQVMTTRIKNYE